MKLVNAHLVDAFTALLAGTSPTQKEKHLKLILSLSLRLQTFNMKSYIHRIASQKMHDKESKTTVNRPFNMYKQKTS